MSIHSNMTFAAVALLVSATALAQAPSVDHPTHPVAALSDSASLEFSFSGFPWLIKAFEEERVGPGNNLFCRSNVVVSGGELHLNVKRSAGGEWCSAEVIGPSLGHGRYTWMFRVPNGPLDSNAVLGLFTWSDNPAFAHRELDFELSRWGEPSSPNAQCVVQPYTNPDNIVRFDVSEGSPITVTLDWTATSMVCTVQFADGDSFTHRFSNAIPPAGDEQVRMNLWMPFPGGPDSGRDQTVIIEVFSFDPME